MNPNAISTAELNKGGILSILTEVYMWQKDYTNALAATDQLIALHRYSLAPTANYKDIFITATTKENIWSLSWDFLTDGGNGIAGKIGASDQTSNYYIDSTVLLKWENNKVDIRRGIAYDTTVADALSRIISIWKFYPVDVTTGKPVTPSRAQNEAKLPLYRWADILLLRAEALNWTGDKPGAFTLLNQVRARARDTALNEADYATQLDVEKVILDERQLELFAEGKRWFDLVRTGRALEVMDPLIRQRQSSLGVAQTGFADPRLILWPISRDALTRDPLLEQNPPYSN